MAKQPWKAWHEVVKLRSDLRSGDLALNMFAADLYEVMMQGGVRPIYERPEEFFALTFPTHNLRSLVKDVVLRLAGRNDKAVRLLELTYGGGKTHTLITMRHLVHDPAKLPDLPAVREFRETIGQELPAARVAALCFDKFDLEKGCEVRGPDGAVRRLSFPWSSLAYQIAGDEGLKVLHAKGAAEERKTPPAENTLNELLRLPGKQGLGTLILLDEVLLFAKMAIGLDAAWIGILPAFFQYLTQAVAKVPRCCIVASLLSSDPKDQADEVGRRVVADLYDIFRRQSEEAVQPVEKDDVAEVLRRRLFDPVAGQERHLWKPHVIAALKGISPLDEQTARQEALAEDRYLRSYPLHPELTEVFYTKWTTIEGFQKTRGVLRTFALALRDAEKWDDSPLVGPAVFLSKPGQPGLSDAARELVSTADHGVTEGQGTRWTGILEKELEIARTVQNDSVGLRCREMEQAVMATFLHSQPTGRSAKTRDLMLLVGPCRPDRIEFEKGLARWARSSHWLDDLKMPEKEGQLPSEWMLGNRPNLAQMQATAAAQISADVVRAKLVEEIGKVKALASGASGLGIRVHVLPARPRDIEDDGLFHYAVLPPSAASDSGKPSAEAKRFLDETTGSEKPRVYRNALLLLAPSREGLDVAHARVRDALAWEQVLDDLTPRSDDDRKQKGTVEVGRFQTLRAHIDKARGRISEAIKQAYCVVVTVSEKDDAHAFRITVTDAPALETIKGDPRSRVRDTAITADALLPGGPYDLWKGGETSRRVKDLAGAFAQLPHLPKMLKAQAIVETLVGGCEQGMFVLRLTRPDRTFRTWWRSRPDGAALSDPALELVLPEAAELAEVSAEAIAPDSLPGLWSSERITVQEVVSYFEGNRVVQVDRGAFSEPMRVPKATAAVVNAAIESAVQQGKVWLLAGPASLLGESIPVGVLSPSATLCRPPAPVPAAALLPENLPDAWQGGVASALAIATALSQAAGATLPWKTVRDAISGALAARFIELAEDSNEWPCELVAAKGVMVAVPAAQAHASAAGGTTTTRRTPSTSLRAAEADFEPSQLQDLADAVPRLLGIKARSNVPLRFHVRLEIGDGVMAPDPKVVEEINQALDGLDDGFRVE